MVFCCPVAGSFESKIQEDEEDDRYEDALAMLNFIIELV